MADPDNRRPQLMAPPMMQMPSLQMPGFRDLQPQPLAPSTPGFNVAVPTPFGWLPQGAVNNIGSALAGMMPSKQDVAETLGAPVDSAAYLLMKAVFRSRGRRRQHRTQIRRRARRVSLML